MFLTKWDPFETLTDLQSDIGRLFERRLPSTQRQGQGITSDWLPAVNIHEDKEALYFDVEAPGIQENNFEVSLQDSVLTIKGTRSREEKKEGKNYYRIEHEYGSFARSFSLPENIDASKMNAEYKRGILHVKIAKKEASKPQQIKVQVSS